MTKPKESIERLDQVFIESFPTNHPAMLDWVEVKIYMKRLEEKERMKVNIIDIGICKHCGRSVYMDMENDLIHHHLNNLPKSL
jgi:hypothetical protein